MNTRIGTEKTIEQLIDATYGNSLSARERYFSREALLSLVRLAKSEQMLEMKATVRKLTHTNAPAMIRQPPQAEQCREQFHVVRSRQFQSNRLD
jgi:hypothetical protein